MALYYLCNLKVRSKIEFNEYVYVVYFLEMTSTSALKRSKYEVYVEMVVIGGNYVQMTQMGGECKNGGNW